MLNILWGNRDEALFALIFLFPVLLMVPRQTIAEAEQVKLAASDSDKVISYAKCYRGGKMVECESGKTELVPSRDADIGGEESAQGEETQRPKGIGRSADGRSCVPSLLKSSGPLVLTSKDNGREITGIRISNPDGICIKVKNARGISIKGSLFEDCKVAIFATNSSNITVEGNRFNNSGSVMKFWQGGGDINVSFNEYRNIGVQKLEWGANFVELNGVKGSGIKIAYNVGECVRAEGCDTEDLVSIFKSEGTENSPIMVVGNEFRGRGFSESGSGVTAGDYGGGFILIKDNIFVNPGQVGIGIAGGHDITIRDNVLFHSDRLALVSGTALMVGNWGGGSPCINHRIIGNRSNWYSSRGKVKSSWWPYGADYDKECAEGIVSMSGNVPALSFEQITGADDSVDAGILPDDLFAGLPPDYFSSCD